MDGTSAMRLESADAARVAAEVRKAGVIPARSPGKLPLVNRVSSVDTQLASAALAFLVMHHPLKAFERAYALRQVGLTSLRRARSTPF